jgi:hypothetical protein
VDLKEIGFSVRSWNLFGSGQKLLEKAYECGIDIQIPKALELNIIPRYIKYKIIIVLPLFNHMLYCST